MAMTSVVSPVAVRWQSSSSHRLPPAKASMAPVGDAVNFLKVTCFGSLACLAGTRSSRSKLKALPATQVASRSVEDSASSEERHDQSWQSFSKLGAKCAAAGDHDAALEAFEAARRSLEQQDSQGFDYAKILMNIGVLQSEAGRSAQALDNFQLAQQLFVDLKRLNSKNGAKLLANIAMAKSQDGSDGAEVVSAFASALRMFKQQGLLRSKEGVRLLIQAGKAKEEMGEFAEALEDYKAARATLEEAGAIGSKMGIEMLEKMSDVQFELDDLEVAEANLVMAVEKTDAQGRLDSLEGARLLQKLGDLQTELNGYQEALTSYRSARQILEDRKELHGFSAACLLSNLATLEAESCSPADGLRLFEEAKNLFLESDALHTEEGADLLVNLAAQCLKAQKVDSALTHLDEAKEVFQSQNLLDDSIAGAKFWMNLGSALMQKQSQEDISESKASSEDGTQKAFRSARNALEASGAEDSFLSVELSALAAQGHIKAGNFQAALDESQQAKALIESQPRMQESDAAAQVFYNLGLCYAEREALDEATDSLNLAVSSLTAQGPLSSALAAEVCGTLADVYFEAGEASKAVEAYDMACQAAESANDMEMEDLALLFTKRGLALAEVDDLEEALKDHEQARSLAEDHGFLQSSLGADILVNMGIAKANGKLLEEAVADFEAALLVLEETELLETELGARVFQDLSIAQKQLGDMDGAAESEANARQILDLCEDTEG